MKGLRKEQLKQFGLVMAEALVLAGITVTAAAPVSCKITEQGITILGGDYTPPVLEQYEVVDERTVRLEFSEKVSVYGYVVSLAGQEDSIPCEVVEGAQDGVLELVLENQMQAGQTYEFYSEVRDVTGNTLTIAVPFAGFNAHVPRLLITEIQSESPGQSSNEAKIDIYRNEFVEILALKGGNLAGLELCNASGGEAKKFVFPAIEVQTGEVFVVHVQKRGSGCISETGTNLELATSAYTSAQARDLWTELEGSVLGNKTDIILIRNSANAQILDAFMYRESKIQEWSKKNLEYAQLVAQSGIYESSDVEQAFVSDTKTGTKTMYRPGAAELQQRVLAGEEPEYPVKACAGDWEILASPTPGFL